MKEFNKVGVYKNLRFERKFEDLELQVIEINPKYLHVLTGKSFDSEESVNSYIDELISKRPRYLVLSKTLDDKELRAIYSSEVDVLSQKPLDIKRFTVNPQYSYVLNDEYYDLYKTFNSVNEVRDYLADEFGLFTGNYDFIGDFEE